MTCTSLLRMIHRTCESSVMHLLPSNGEVGDDVFMGTFLASCMANAFVKMFRIKSRSA